MVGVLGCMAERLKERLFSAKTVDIVAGPDALRSVPDLIDLFIQVLSLDTVVWIFPGAAEASSWLCGTARHAGGS